MPRFRFKNPVFSRLCGFCQLFPLDTRRGLGGNVQQGEAWLQLLFGEDRVFDRIVLQEHLPLGQRVKAHEIQAFVGNDWKTIATGTTIGYKRIHRLPEVKARRIRVHITDAFAPPAIEQIGLYKASSRETPY